MRTTIRLDDGVLADAKELAARTGRTLGQVIEDALRESLARRTASTQPRVELPTSRLRGGLQPGVDLDDSAALLDLMEADDPPV
jgi:hypothetical protein